MQHIILPTAYKVYVYASSPVYASMATCKHTHKHIRVTAYLRWYTCEPTAL